MCVCVSYTGTCFPVLPVSPRQFAKLRQKEGQTRTTRVQGKTTIDLQTAVRLFEVEAELQDEKRKMLFVFSVRGCQGHVPILPWGPDRHVDSGKHVGSPFQLGPVLPARVFFFAS